MAAALASACKYALINSIAHVVVTEGLVNEADVAERCEPGPFQKWREFVSQPKNSPEAMASVTGVPAEMVRGAARLYATGGLRPTTEAKAAVWGVIKLTLSANAYRWEYVTVEGILDSGMDVCH